MLLNILIYNNNLNILQEDEKVKIKISSQFEKLSDDQKITKQVIDKTLKSFLEAKNVTEENLKQFCTEHMTSKENSLRSEIKQLIKDVENTRIENGKYHLEAIRIVNDAKIEMNNFTKMKNDIVSQWLRERQLFKDNENLFLKVKSEFTETEKTHNEILEDLKVKFYLKLGIKKKNRSN